MAAMWPKVLPDWVLSDPRRAAEISVFRRLEKDLDNTWTVFYSRPWWGIGPKGGELDGEADFIVVHPEHGLLFIEVKGGRISYDPALQQWWSRDRNRINHKIKDPVGQAKGCKHAFLKKLKEVPGWPAGFIRFRHGVIFPDSVPPPESDPTLGSYDKQLFCHVEEFERALDRWILGRLAPHPVASGNTEHGPGQTGVNAVHELVAKPVCLRVPMLREVQGDIDSMDSLLTGAQLALISLIDSQMRALVEGGAGTGKTVLAIEMAARHAELGRSVLFCCRSGPLATRTSERLKKFDKITVKKFDELAALCCWADGKRVTIPDGRLWDVVIVDEGQDFDWEWWNLIDQIVGKTDGWLRVFADSNQAVYRLRDDLETRLGATSFPLRINLRNTRLIAKATESLYDGPLIETPGPVGTPPVCKTDNMESATQRAMELLFELIQDEHLVPSMIAVLVPDANKREEILTILSRRRVLATNADRLLPSAVVVETVARYKGLEAPVVLLIADKALAMNQELSYVGVSRARSRLMVFGPVAGSMLERAVRQARDSVQ